MKCSISSSRLISDRCACKEWRMSLMRDPPVCQFVYLPQQQATTSCDLLVTACARWSLLRHWFLLWRWQHLLFLSILAKSVGRELILFRPAQFSRHFLCVFDEHIKNRQAKMTKGVIKVYCTSVTTNTKVSCDDGVPVG